MGVPWVLKTLSVFIVISDNCEFVKLYSVNLQLESDSFWFWCFCYNCISQHLCTRLGLPPLAPQEINNVFVSVPVAIQVVKTESRASQK